MTVSLTLAADHGVHTVGEGAVNLPSDLLNLFIPTAVTYQDIVVCSPHAEQVMVVAMGVTLLRPSGELRPTLSAP